MLLKYVVGNVLQEMAADSDIGAWFEWTAAFRLCALVQWEANEHSPPGDVAITAISEMLRAWIENNLSFTVSIGIGKEIGHMREIAASYEEALHALEFRSALGLNRVIASESLSPRSKLAVYDLLQELNVFAQSFRLLEAGWEDQYEKLFERIRLGLFPRDDLRGMMNYFIYQMNRGFAEMSRDYADLWENRTLPELERLLDEFHTYEELRERLFGMLAASAIHIREIHASKSHYALIAQAKAYIESNFYSPDLSLSLISDQCSITPSQLSRLFKEQHGEKFVDYIAGYRMGKAKELLVQTSDPVQDIARQVGYLHSFSFIRTFKKFYGKTPGEYRDNQQTKK
jgi:AraC-like DNA-binding protein